MRIIDADQALKFISHLVMPDDLTYTIARDVARKVICDVPTLNCDGCKHEGKYEDEQYYGYNCPCIRCIRLNSDRYEEG